MTEFESLIFYISIYIFASFLLSIKKSKYTQLLCFVGLLLLVTVASLRYYVGTDYVTYTNIVVRNSNLAWKEIFHFSNIFNEFGFLILTKLSYQIGGLKLFFALCALLTLLPIYFTIKKEFPKIDFGIAFTYFLFFYYPTSYNIIRQYIAAAIIFYSIKFIFKGDFVKFLLMVVLAFLFHKSSISILPIYFLWNKEEQRIVDIRTTILVVIVGGLLLINFQSLIEKISSFEAFSNYENFSIIQERVANRDFFVYIIIFFVFFIFRKHLQNIDPRNNLFIIMFFLSLMIGYTGFYHPQIKRIGIYYQLPSMMILGYFPMIFKKDNRFIVKFSIIIVSILFFIIVFYYMGNGQIFPYRIA